MNRRRLALAIGILALAGLLPLVGYLALGQIGLLASLVVLHLLLLLLVLRVWLSLDGSVRSLEGRLRREVGRMRKRLERGLDKAELREHRTAAEEIVKQVKAERQAIDTRLLEHERKAWELQRETVRQIDQGFQTQKGEIQRRHERTGREVERLLRAESVQQKREIQRRHELTGRNVERLLRAEFAQIEALAALYYELKPPVAFPATRSWVASPDLLRHLYLRIRRQPPGLVLECGSGLSTVVMAYGMRASGHGGRVVALEHLEEFAEVTRRMLEEHGLTAHAEVRLAPLEEIELEGETWPWYDRSQLPSGPIDLLFVDGPPGHTRPHARFPAVPVVRDLLSPGASIILDDHRREEEATVAERWLESIDGLRLEELHHEKGTAVLTVDDPSPDRSPPSSSARAPEPATPETS